MKSLDRFSNWLCKPPFDGVVWLAWFYVIFACLIKGGGPFDGNLAWFDDHVRMVQILDWLNGQSWYDRTIYRANGPEGFHSIWSRLPDLPYAAIIAVLQNFTDQYHAAMTSAILVPLVETLLLFLATAYLAVPLVGKKYANLAILFALFSSCINAEYFTLAGFQLGSVGHHSWYVLLNILLCAAAARLINRDKIKNILVAGLAIGMSAAIGIEGLPLIAGVCATFALTAWTLNRSDLAGRAACFAFIGALIALALLPTHQPPEKLLSISFAEPSLLGPILIACAALFSAIEFLLLQQWGKRKYICAAALLTLAALFAAALVHAFPQILNGPAAALSPEERAIASEEHTEAFPLFRVAFNTFDFIRLVMPCLMALSYAAYLLWRGKNKKQDAVAAIYLGFALVPFGMALLLSRYYHHAIIMAAPWLTLVLRDSWMKLSNTKAAYLNRFLIFIALAPLWTLFAQATMLDVPFRTSVLLFPSKRQEKNEACDVKSIANFLNRHYGNDKVIMVPMYRSGEFLFNLKMKLFFLANFPSQNKFLPIKHFYKTLDPNEAKRIAFDNRIDLVATCKLGGMHTKSDFAPNLTAQASSFNQQLLNGVAPSWLVPVKLDLPSPYVLYEVKR